jgi:hypothetical protein
MWAVGGYDQVGDAMHWDGKSWTGIQHVAVDDLHGVWGSTSDDVWAVGDTGVAIRWNGSTWTQYAGTTNLNAVWGTTGSDVWGVGYNSEIKHWDGTSWGLDPSCQAPAPFPPYGCPGSGGPWTLFDVWGTSASDIWAVGGGVLAHRDATKWTVIENNYYFSLMSVWGTASNDVWAVGWYLDESVSPYVGHSLVRHYDGTTWTKIPVNTSAVLRGVGGTSASDVWISGDGGLLYHWDGASLKQWDSGTINDLLAIRSTSTGMYVSGTVGSVMFRAN